MLVCVAFYENLQECRLKIIFCKINICVAQKLHCIKLTDFVKNLLLKLFTVRELYCSHAGHVQIALFFTVLTFCISNALLNLVWHHWNPPGCFGACLPVPVYCQYNKGDIFSRHKRSSHMIYCTSIMQLQRQLPLELCWEHTAATPLVYRTCMNLANLCFELCLQSYSDPNPIYNSMNWLRNSTCSPQICKNFVKPGASFWVAVQFLS